MVKGIDRQDQVYLELLASWPELGIGNNEEVIYCCYDEGVPKTWGYLFLKGSNTARQFQTYFGILGVSGLFLLLKCFIYRWQNTNCSTELSLVYQAMLVFILWIIQKVRNTILHGGNQSYQRKEMEVNNNNYMFAKVKYPQLLHIPSTWTFFFLVKIQLDYNN